MLNGRLNGFSNLLRGFYVIIISKSTQAQASGGGDTLYLRQNETVDV